jgi:hypothetical protein
MRHIILSVGRVTENQASQRRVRALAGRRRKHRCAFDALEARALFAGDLRGAVADGLTSTAQNAALVRLYDDVQMHQVGSPFSIAQTNGDVLVESGGGSQVFQKVPKGWKLISSDQQTSTGWVQETWTGSGDYSQGGNGRYVQTVWKSRDHGAVGAAGSISQTVVADGKMTVTLYHQTGNYPAYGYSFFASPQNWTIKCENATITWTYNVDKNGNRGELQEYVLKNGGYYTNAGGQWMLNPPSKWYTDKTKKIPGGWNLGFPGGKNSQGKFIPPPKFPDSLVTLNVAPAKLDKPPGTGSTSRLENGTWAVFVDTDRGILVFNYKNDSEQQLLVRTRQYYGGYPSNDWVETATAVDAKDFITETNTFNKQPIQGGKLLSTVLVKKAPNDDTVTFTGTWTKGTTLANATGKMTADNYLGFRSVTVEYKDGRPVMRNGPLQRGGYAVDTFDPAGTAVTKREIFNTAGGKLVETWTGDANVLDIKRVDPSAEIKGDTFKYVWKSKSEKGYSPGYTLVNYNANLTKEVTFYVEPKGNNGRDEVKRTTYDWRAYTSYSKADEDWNWHYRELGSYNASDSPSLPFAWSAPTVNYSSHYWYQA